MLRSFLIAALVSMALFPSGGCSSPSTCYEGDFIACECDDGRRGYAACDVAADRYGACGSCGAALPGGSAVPTGGGGAAPTGGAGGTGGAALLGFMETCTEDEECESGLCHNYNAKGPKCTIPCQSDGDCPLPSPGCNNMGVCKAP